MDRPVYRIPKNVETRLTFGGMDWRGWLVIAIGALVGIMQFLLWKPHTLNGLLFSLGRLALCIGIPYLFAQDPKLVGILRNLQYHRKNKSLLRWESDPNAILALLQKDEDNR